METLRIYLSVAFLLGSCLAITEESMRHAMLQKLGLSEVPTIQKRDLENIVVPTHIRNKYVSMLKLNNKRRRRSVASLAGILRGIPGSADMSREVVYADTSRQSLSFDMDNRIPDNCEVTMAELKLYKISPSKQTMTRKRSSRPSPNARVSIYWVEHLLDGKNRTSIVDSRLVPIYESGWTSFDVTQAVIHWSKTARKTPLRLEVWIEGERPGSRAAEMARAVRFALDHSGDNSERPDLVLFTLDLEEFGSRGDCKLGKSNGVCCREEHFINFREMSWTQFWIIEPSGYQAFRCAGECRQSKRNYGYGQRECAVVESASLPVMYLVKRGEHTVIEVAEFPNMIVEKCGCVMDDGSVP